MYSFYSIPVFIISALVIPIVGIKKSHLASYISLIASIISIVFVTATILDIMENGIVYMQMGGWKAPFGITVVMDGFSILVASITTILGFITTLYSIRYIKEKRSEYYSLLSILLAGLLGIIHTGDMFNLFVFMEVASISSYALTSFKRTDKAFESGIKYLIIGSLATSLYLLGISFLYAFTGTLNMADMSFKLSGMRGYGISLAISLILTGLAIKIGLVPFHTWLPDVYTSSPCPISAIFSSATNISFMYAIIRLILTVFISSNTIGVLILFGILSMFVGAVLSLLQNDLKRLLAYSSISQIGYVALAFGIGTYLGTIGGLFHMMNQAFIKSLLFFSSGIVIMSMGTSDMRLMESVKFDPVLKYSFLIGIFSLAGIPMFSGFSSKLIIYIAMFRYQPLLMVFTGIVSAITIAYCFKSYYLVFLRNAKLKPDMNEDKLCNVPITFKIPLLFLAFVCLLFGILPQFGIEISNFVISNFNNQLYIKTILG